MGAFSAAGAPAAASGVTVAVGAADAGVEGSTVVGATGTVVSGVAGTEAAGAGSDAAGAGGVTTSGAGVVTAGVVGSVVASLLQAAKPKTETAKRLANNVFFIIFFLYKSWICYNIEKIWVFVKIVKFTIVYFL